jgi:hypothetical protein
MSEEHEYILTYARVVIFKRYLMAEDRKHALTLALDLEHEDELGIDTITAKNGSVVDDTQDYDAIWEVERA